MLGKEVSTTADNVSEARIEPLENRVRAWEGTLKLLFKTTQPDAIKATFDAPPEKRTVSAECFCNKSAMFTTFPTEPAILALPIVSKPLCIQ